MATSTLYCEQARCATVISEALHRLERAIHRSVQEGVRVDFHEGVIILRGWTKSFYQKQLIQEALRGIEGVEGIVNSVEVVDRIP